MSRKHKIPWQVLESPNDAIACAFRDALNLGVTPQGWLAIEGPILLAEALKASRETAPGDAGDAPAASRLKIHHVLVTERAAVKLESALRRLPPGTEVTAIASRLFKRWALTETPQGVAALVELPERHLDRVLAQPNAAVVVACGLQDPGNLGAILRSAWAFGASALITLANTVSPRNPKAVRASAGAIFYLPVFEGQNLDSLCQRLRGAGLRIVAAEAEAPGSAAETNLEGPLAILIGREASGLDEATARQADLRVGIPMRRQVDSVNAAAAAAVLLYECARQRGFKFDEHEPV